MTELVGTTPDIAPVDAIRVGERDRTEMGNLDELADSIKAVGLLHPVVVTADNELVAGGRRLAAVKQLGWTEVPVTVVDLATAADVLRAELEENTCRKPLSPLEASYARERRAKVLAPQAAERKAHGKTAPGRPLALAGEAMWDEPEVDASSKLDEAPAASRATRKVAAIGTGYSGSSIDKVDEIRRVAEQGVTKVGTGKSRREVELPESVREVARQHLPALAQTDAAIEPAYKAVQRAVTESLVAPVAEQLERDGSADELRRLKWQATFQKDLARAFQLISMYKPEQVAAGADDGQIEDLRQVSKSLAEYVSKIEALRDRPAGLTLVVGG